jgi:hypothetical protein
MAYPVDTAVETAIGTIELVLKEDPTLLGNREAVGVWRELLAFMETTGATGYDALTQTSDANWIAEKNFGAS